MNEGGVPDRPEDLLDRAYAEFTEAWVDGQEPDPDEFCRRYPSCAEALRARIHEFLQVTGYLRADSSKLPEPRLRQHDGKERLHGEILGDFRIIREIGRGGMGVVYEARQISLGRIVAIKVLPAHLTLRDESVARFKREASTAARLRHPGIVEIYAVGEEKGTHFFAMEFVEGAPLDKVIDAIRREGVPPIDGWQIGSVAAADMHRQTDEGERDGDAEEDEPASFDFWNRTYIETVCRIVVQVADALQHAHKNGVMHRDVKPSNILIRADGRVVLTDFGLARKEGLPSVTVTGELAGTPHYISPEQAMPRPKKVDHRTDIYSLGVTLFELLTLKRPYDGKTSQEVLGKIVTREPPLLRKLNDLIPRDLETVCLAAMEKDRARRYQTAEEFRQDVIRFLEFRPVHARPVGLASRTFRMIRRNPAYSTMIGLAALVVVGGPLIFGFQQKLANIRIREALQAKEDALLRVDREAEKARLEAETTKEISECLINLFKVPDPYEARGKNIAVYELLQEGAKLAKIRLKQRPEIRARLLETMGSVYINLGVYSEAEPLLEEALEIHGQDLGEEDPLTLQSIHRLGQLYSYQGRYKEAEHRMMEARTGCIKVLGPDHRATLAVTNDLAMLYRLKSRNEEAEPLFLQTLEARRRLLGEDDPDTLESMNNLAFFYRQLGRFDEAEPYFLKSLDGRRRHLGDSHPDTLTSLCELAVLYAKQGRVEEAEPLFMEALEKRSRILGEAHPDTITSRYKLAVFYVDEGRIEEAEPLFIRTLEERRRILGEDHPKTLIAMTYLAIVRHRQGRTDEADILYAQAEEAQRRVLGGGHNFTVFTLHNRACFYHDLGRDGEAEPLAREAVERTHVEHPFYKSRRDLLDAVRRKLEGD